MRPGRQGTAELPRRAGVIVIGGGVIGCSVACHLARSGRTDVLLLERRRITSGTTWHAAGLLGQLRQSVAMTNLARYTSELYARLEEETGQATGFRRCGSLSVTADPERFEELQRGASLAKVLGLQVDVVTAKTIGERVPLLETSDLLGGLHIPGDGYADPTGIAQALAAGARAAGARIVEQAPVTSVRTSGGRAVGVTTEQGDVDADCVVLCAGMWTRELAAPIGVNVPLHACEHYYVRFDGVDGLDANLPVVRDYDAISYFRYDAGKLIVGVFEPNARPWGMDGIPEDFCFDEIAANREDSPLEAGLGFAVRFDKPGGFVGREALLRQRESGIAKRLVQFRLRDPRPLLYHYETDLAGGRDRGLRHLRELRPQPRSGGRPRLRPHVAVAGLPGTARWLRHRGRGRPRPGRGFPPAHVRPWRQARSQLKRNWGCCFRSARRRPVHDEAPRLFCEWAALSSGRI